MKLKSLIYATLLFGTLLTFTPQASATHTASPGLSGTVVFENIAGSQQVTFVFEISPEDTSGAPTYTYHLWQGQFVPTDLGDVSSFTTYEVQGRFVSFTYLEIGGTTSDFFWIESDDGTDTLAGCTIQLNTANLNENDACGNILSGYDENYCIPRSPDDDFGFDYYTGVTKAGTKLFYQRPNSASQAIAGLTLAGDSISYQWYDYVTGDADSRINYFFSQVNTDASIASVPSATPGTPQDNAWSDGIGFILLGDGDPNLTGAQWILAIYFNEGGSTEVIGYWETGELTTEKNVIFTIDTQAERIRVNLGSSAYYAAMSGLNYDAPETGARSFWVRSNGADGTLHGRATATAQSCLYTAGAGQGGSSSVPTPEAPEVPGLSPPGLRALVESDTVEFRFQFSGLDPNQATGDYDYELWIDDGSGEFLIGDVSTFTAYQEANGLASFTVPITFPPLPVGSYFIQGVDGDDNRGSSCQVSVTLTLVNDYDSCGTLVVTFQEQYCIPRLPTEELSGFNYRFNVDILADLEAFSFFRNPGEQAQSLAALNLPGDSRSYKFLYTIEADVDGSSSNFNFFYSTTGASVGSSQAPSGQPQRPTDGAFEDGYGFNLVESGDDWIASIYTNTGGSQSILEEVTWTPNPNDPQSGYFTVDPWAGIIQANMGANTIQGDLDDAAIEPGASTSFWLRENGGGSILQAETFLYYDTASNLCLYTAPVNQFGSGGEIATGGETQGIPGFFGEGGYLGNPSFPGINIPLTATNMGITAQELGFIMAGVLAVIVGIAGFHFLGVIGGGAGVFASSGLAALLGLIPMWFLVLVFILLTTVVILSSRLGAET